MGNDAWAAQFDQQRDRLQAIATRVLGSSAEADDAVQEAWIRLSRAEDGSIDNLTAWLTTVVSRIALDLLRARGTRERAADALGSTDPAAAMAGHDPESDAELADGVTAALMVVLDTLQPAERLAFILHDTFDVPFGEIGAVLGRSPAAAKQLASRARNKVRGIDDSTPPNARDHAVVEAFLAAARGGQLADLVALLAPDIELHADLAGVAMGAPARLDDADAVAGSFSGRALGAVPAEIDGVPAMVWIVADRPKVAWEFTIEDDHVVRIDMIADPETLDGAELVVRS